VLITLIRYVGGAIAVLMGVGAVFAALNTMYSAVSSRTREIATLRALGFGAAPVVASVLIEAMVLGLLGGVAGGCCLPGAQRLPGLDPELGELQPDHLASR
jgi:putative ABC transport system permease protein